MFDVSFSELMVIVIIALLVIGPEKLPKVARTVGLLVGRMQRYVNNIKVDISREMQFEDLQKLQQDIRHGANRIRGELDQVQSHVAAEARSVENSIGSALDEVKKPATPPDERL